LGHCPVFCLILAKGGGLLGNSDLNGKSW